jgi:23S rRNA (guanosine2251-2'-O)-methyltransferase
VSRPPSRGGKRPQRRDAGSGRGGASGRGASGGRDGRSGRGAAGGSGASGGRDGRGGQDERIVVGLHPVRELLRAGQPVRRILVSTTRASSPVLDDLRQAARQAGIRVDEVDAATIDERADGLVHQGVIALMPPFAYARLDDVLARAERAGEPPLLVALDGVTDPHNLGSIARTAEAVGAHGLLVPSRRTVGVTPTAEKAAAGALAHLPVVEVTNLVRTLADLHERGVWSIGLDGDADGELADHPLATEPCVLVVGAEGAGLARLTRERCDALVKLPMRGRVGSLNASVAAGVALYELLRRRSTG